MSQERGFAHLVLILALFGVIFLIAFFFLQVRTPSYSTMTNPLPSVKSVNASDIETDKTYSSNLLSLSFSYSSGNYEAKEDSEDAYFKRANGDARKNFNYYVGYLPGGFIGAVNLVGKNGQQFDDAPFVIWVFGNPDNLDAAGWYKKYWYYPFNWGQFESGEKQKIAPVNETTVGGEAASDGEISYQAGSPKYYYISKNNKMYLIRVLGDGESILRTIKFL